ncbi:MAG: hypothetical protein J7K65_01685 [Planctomycetes bacterium]|nr:hypothetical protein [Planctomycetota bacterium]
MVRSADTSQITELKQIETLRRMGLPGRAELTFQLCDNLRQITKAGIRHRHPDYTDQQITQAYLRLILELELFQQIFPGCEIEP